MIFMKGGQVTEQVTEQVLKLIKIMEKKEYSNVELMELVEIKHRPTFLYNYLQPAIEFGLIDFTIPNKPNSNKQKYKLTELSKNYK